MIMSHMYARNDESTVAAATAAMSRKAFEKLVENENHADDERGSDFNAM